MGWVGPEGTFLIPLEDPVKEDAVAVEARVIHDRGSLAETLHLL